MRKLLLSLIFVFLLPISYSAGGFGEGNFNDGVFDFGTPFPTPEPQPSSPSVSRGGGGGGIYIPPDTSQQITYRMFFLKGNEYDINIGGKAHKIVITDIGKDNSKMLFKSSYKEILLLLNIPSYLNYDDDNYNDLEIILKNIYTNSVEVLITNVKILIEKPIDTEEPIKEPEVIEKEEEPEFITEPEIIKVREGILEPQPKKISGFEWVLVVLVVVIVLGFFYYLFKEIKKEEKSEKENGKKTN